MSKWQGEDDSWDDEYWNASDAATNVIVASNDRRMGPTPKWYVNALRLEFKKDTFYERRKADFYKERKVNKEKLAQLWRLNRFKDNSPRPKGFLNKEFNKKALINNSNRLKLSSYKTKPKFIPYYMYKK